MDLRCLTVDLTGTGISVSCSQVNSVWAATKTICFWLSCADTVVEPETTEAEVRLERAAFLAS